MSTSLSPHFGTLRSEQRFERTGIDRKCETNVKSIVITRMTLVKMILLPQAKKIVAVRCCTLSA